MFPIVLYSSDALHVLLIRPGQTVALRVPPDRSFDAVGSIAEDGLVEIGTFGLGGNYFQ